MPTPDTPEPEYLTLQETARLLQISPTTLTRWHQRGIGPRRYQWARTLIRYRRDEVLAGEWPTVPAIPRATTVTVLRHRR